MKQLSSAGIGLLLALQLGAQQVPANWKKGGTWSGSFSLFSDKFEVAEGKQSLRLSSKGNEIYGSGTIEQEFDAKDFRGKTIRFTAKIKGKNIRNWASIFVSIDNQPNANDWSTEGNTYKKDEKIIGNSNWSELSLERKVPADARKIKIGLVQVGSGTCWMDDMKLEAIDSPAPSSNGPLALPGNLNAEESIHLDSTKIFGYRLEGQEVVFRFNPIDYQEITSMWQGGTEGIGKIKKIKTVVLASQLNDWNPKDKRYTLLKKDKVWEIRIPLQYFSIDQCTEFKFVINGRYWVEPMKQAANQTKAGDWEYSNNYFFVYPGNN